MPEQSGDAAGIDGLGKSRGMSNKYEDLIKNARVNAECGEHMSPAEVTTLLNVVETTFSALAAENAGLKNAFGPGDAVLNFLTIALRHTTYDQIDLDDVTLAFRMSLPETPATDTYLAEVRAQGV